MLQGQLRRSIRLIPVRSTLVQRRDDIGFAAAKLAEQELPEQCVIAIPLSPTVERDQEQVGGLQVAQASGGG